MSPIGWAAGPWQSGEFQEQSLRPLPVESRARARQKHQALCPRHLEDLNNCTFPALLCASAPQSYFTYLGKSAEFHLWQLCWQTGEIRAFIWVMNCQAVRRAEYLCRGETGQGCRRGSASWPWEGSGRTGLYLLLPLGVCRTVVACVPSQDTETNQRHSWAHTWLRELSRITLHSSNQGLPHWGINWQVGSRNW